MKRDARVNKDVSGHKGKTHTAGAVVKRRIDLIISHTLRRINYMKIMDILKKRRSSIQRNYYVKEIGVFGSVARGQQKKNSDIDILIEFKMRHKDFFNYMRLKYYLEELFGKNVDLVVKKLIKPRLKKRILNEVKYV